MAIIELERKMSWVVKGCAMFESDWMAMHRFLWMNAISCEDLWWVLKGQKYRGHSLSNNRRLPANFSQLIRDNKLTHDFGLHFHARSLDNCFGSLNGRVMSTVESIRFCPLCLKECFHSPLFQLATVNKCPVHGSKLLTACQHCGNSVGQPTLNTQMFNVPLMCMHCMRPFLDAYSAAKVFCNISEGEATFTHLEEWLKQLSLVQFVRADELGGASGNLGDYKAICDSLVILATDNLKTPSWLEANFPFTVYRRRNDPNFLGVVDFALQNRTVPLEQDLDCACRIAKSINHNLSRRVRAICGHRKTANLPWKNAERPFQRVQPVLKMAQGDCPCCAILDQWRAYAGKLIALRNLARDFGQPVFEREFGDTRILFSLEPRECAEALISSFTWFANALSSILLKLAGQKSSFGFPEKYHSLEFTPHIQSLSLDVYRFEISPQGYVVAKQGEEITLAYSLKHAFESLYTCQELYRNLNERLCQAGGVNGYKHSRNDRCDDWYVSMSTYMHTRQNTHLWASVPNPNISNIFTDR